MLLQRRNPLPMVSRSLSPPRSHARSSRNKSEFDTAASHIIDAHRVQGTTERAGVHTEDEVHDSLQFVNPMRF